MTAEAMVAVAAVMTTAAVAVGISTRAAGTIIIKAGIWRG